MFDRFTERARKVMTLSRMEAQNLQNDYIGTEHILLGLVQEGSGVAAQVLTNLGMDLRKVRAEVERLVEQGESPVPPDSQLPFTPRAKRVLERALEESQGLGHNYIGTEHLLLGLIREKDGPAAHVLQGLGVKPEDVRDGIAKLLGVEIPAGGALDRPGLFRRFFGQTTHPVVPGWESVPPSPALDWLLVVRNQARAKAMMEEGLPWATATVDLELLPGPGEWEYRLNVRLVPERQWDAVCLTVPGGLLKDMEKDLPGIVESLVRSIKGEG